MKSLRRTSALVLSLALLTALTAACSLSQVSTASDEIAGSANATLESAGVIETRPSATATPGAITQAVENVAASTGVADISFLGLAGSDWINLLVSFVLVIVGYIAGSWLVAVIARWLDRYLQDPEAKELLRRIGRLLKWIVVLGALYLGVVRLQFVSPAIKIGFSTLALAATTVLLGAAAWLLIDLVERETTSRLQAQGRAEEMAPALVLMKRLARIVVVLVALSAFLSAFGINMTALAAVIGVGALAFSLAARDTIADAIAGIIILLDRPFRIGDRIEIAAANTWGDVTDIGLRTTRILTRDNRLVIVPNSLISNNEIINYSYPDPNYRIETHVGLSYDTDIEVARGVMRDAVRQVPAVLEDKPVDVLYSDMGDSAMIFRVRWWIETYADTRRVTDQVHTSLQSALDEAGIVSPFPTQSIILLGDGPETDESD